MLELGFEPKSSDSESCVFTVLLHEKSLLVVSLNTYCAPATVLGPEVGTLKRQTFIFISWSGGRDGPQQFQGDSLLT